MPEKAPASPDEQLLEGLLEAFEVFSHRLREIRRLGRYVRERGEEIDDAKTRARELIQQQLSEVNDDALDELMESWRQTVYAAAEAEGLSDDDRREVVQSALEEASQGLPEGALSSYLRSIVRVTIAPPAAPMLLASLLIALVGELETLFGSVTRALYIHDPTKLEQSGKQYAWAEIKKFGTLDDFEAHVRDHTVDRMLHGSFGDWVSELKNRFHIPEPARSGDFETLEIIQRRHLMVHNRGFVSRQYLEKLDQFEHDTKLHDELEVDYDYLTRAADTLLVVSLSLISGATFRVTSNEEVAQTMEGFLANTCFWLLQEKRYEAVVDITRRLPVGKVKTELYRHIIQVNGWIALKQLGRFRECADAVRRFDVSARSNDLRLAKLALLDDVERADKLAQQMLAEGQLLHEHWLTWPLLADVRAYHDRQTLGEAEGASQA
ncbi:hypothetical protein LQK89_02825 [Curtobacterium sp. C1]|uniref:hypothetical protein n=1 Tax=Curtobacterium sp. C1 TaxID=2898151 RepID=UPI001E3CE2E5|nr:hypothetical protein [Curtobacterium sp. C1]UFU14652.1 hypothetical protein LQK89_02825 [Curtobacterium sp. C1]